MENWPQVSIDTEKDFAYCFVCGQDNPIGLKLRFYQDGKTARAEFTPSKLYQGWSGILHGGITACLLDEAMSYAALFDGINTVTAKMEVRLKRPISIDEPLSITGSIARRTRKLVETQGTISLNDGTVVAESTAKQFVVSPRTKKVSDD